MGYISAVGMLESTDETTALYWHLRHNHFPPLPAGLMPVAQEAIDNYSEDTWDDPIELPTGMLFKDRNWITVGEAIDAMHLEAFIEGKEF